MKILESIFGALIIFLLTLYTFNYLQTLNENYIKLSQYKTKFISARAVMKLITESPNFTYNKEICNLNISYFKTLNNTSFVNILMQNNIVRPTLVIITNLSNTSQKIVLGTLPSYDDYIVMKRICYSNKDLFLVKIIT